LSAAFGSISLTDAMSIISPGLFRMRAEIGRWQGWYVAFAGFVRSQALSRQFYGAAEFTRTEQAVRCTQEVQACPFAFARYGVG
jgi:hypothetical protein